MTRRHERLSACHLHTIRTRRHVIAAGARASYDRVQFRVITDTNGEKTEMVWSRDEEGRRVRSEESDDERDTLTKEERETEDKMEGRVQKRLWDRERAREETGHIGERRPTIIPANPDDGKSQRRR